MEKYTAKTLNELLNTVAGQKNVEPEELIYYILEEKKGLLGFGAQVTAEVYCLQDVSEFIEEYLKTFFTGLDQQVEIEVIRDGSFFKVFLNADNNAIIIGKNGRTLQALNQVTKASVGSTFKHRYNLLIDINNYKNDRYQKLKAMAQRIGKSVQRTKVTATLDPMPNDERKIIHQELTGMRNIRTESEGYGNQRHLKVVYDATKSTEEVQ